LLDRLGQEVDFSSLVDWVDTYYNRIFDFHMTLGDPEQYTSDFCDKTFSLRTVDLDIMHHLEQFYSMGQQHIFIQYIHAIVDGLNTPHHDITLYKRCLKTIKDLITLSKVEDERKIAHTYDGGIRVWFYEGAFGGILSLLQKIVAGFLVVDQKLIDLVIDFFRFISRYYDDTRFIYVANKYLGGHNFFVLIADFFRLEMARDSKAVFDEFLKRMNCNFKRNLCDDIQYISNNECVDPYQMDDYKLYYDALKLYMELDRESYPIFRQERNIREYFSNVEKHIFTNI
tara:strand:+ start:2083 stop:2937 length:855 start_codon:yes stop_codon:yes gene_type:complete